MIFRRKLVSGNCSCFSFPMQITSLNALLNKCGCHHTSFLSHIFQYMKVKQPRLKKILPSAILHEYILFGQYKHNIEIREKNKIGRDQQWCSKTTVLLLNYFVYLHWHFLVLPVVWNTIAVDERQFLKQNMILKLQLIWAMNNKNLTRKWKTFWRKRTILMIFLYSFRTFKFLPFYKSSLEKFFLITSEFL